MIPSVNLINKSMNFPSQTRKISVISGSRAEYGLLRNLIRLINDDISFELNIIATGAHLSKNFGRTIDEITSEFENVIEIDILDKSFEANGIATSVSNGVLNFSKFFKVNKPDLIILLGDRYEIFSAAIAALFHKITIAHIHGGERSEGAYDEAFRHSITKMSHIHFVATEEYKKRVIQLGENPDSVFNTGSLGVDNINLLTPIAKDVIEDKLNFKFLDKNLLITFHPSTLDPTPQIDQLDELLSAISSFQDTCFIFTMSNADTNGDQFNSKIELFCKNNKNSYFYQSLGQELFFSLLRIVDGIVGNSSSGIIEAPSFGIATIDIGNRQKGRIKAESVINCDAKESSIIDAINFIYSNSFQKKLLNLSNPYGKPGAAKKILQILKKENFENKLIKKFYDL